MLVGGSTSRRSTRRPGDPGQSYLPRKKIETSVRVFVNFCTDIHNCPWSYQVFCRPIRGDRAGLSLRVIRPVSLHVLTSHQCAYTSSYDCVLFARTRRSLSRLPATTNCFSLYRQPRIDQSFMNFLFKFETTRKALIKITDRYR